MTQIAMLIGLAVLVVVLLVIEDGKKSNRRISDLTNQDELDERYRKKYDK